jgi:hypothetical protein
MKEATYSAIAGIQMLLEAYEVTSISGRNTWMRIGMVPDEGSDRAPTHTFNCSHGVSKARQAPKLLERQH